jgi:hypothetical protein
VAAYEPWTAASRWEQALVAKVQGFGGVVPQCSPALLLVAFRIPQTLEQQPQRAVQAALALRQLVAEGVDHGSSPALRLAGTPHRARGPGGGPALPGDAAAGRGLVPGAAARGLAPR